MTPAKRRDIPCQCRVQQQNRVGWGETEHQSACRRHHLFCFLFYFFHFSFTIFMSFHEFSRFYSSLSLPLLFPVLLGGRKWRQARSWAVLGCLQVLTHDTQLCALDLATEMLILTCVTYVHLYIDIIILEKELCSEYHFCLSQFKRID